MYNQGWKWKMKNGKRNNETMKNEKSKIKQWNNEKWTLEA